MIGAAFRRLPNRGTAGRLESIAEPGGIVTSYETYALVQDMVSARPLEPTRIKGIARKVAGA